VHLVLGAHQALAHGGRRRLVLLWHLPGDALIEFVVWRRLGLWITFVLPDVFTEAPHLRENARRRVISLVERLLRRRLTVC
jgi:hypothetical protein